MPKPATVTFTLTVAEVPQDLPAYDRDDWNHWTDADGDCQNTRAEVLIAESLVPVTFDGCRVVTGLWTGLYAGISGLTDAADLDVDHMVPLGNAHNSGGWSWDAAKKKAYANDLTDPDHLIAVTSSANRSKGAHGPEDWVPPDVSYRCEYGQDWARIKDTWELSVTQAEFTALGSLVATCPYAVELVAVAGQPEPFPTPTAEGTPIPTAGLIVITEIMIDPNAVADTAGEWVELYNPSADTPVDINGWTIRDLGSNSHVIDPDGPLMVLPQQFIVLARSMDPTANGAGMVDYQTTGITYGNTSDEVELVDLNGNVVDTVSYNASMVYTGASTSLSPSALSATSNDDPANWCASTSLLPGGDRGTPGRVNDPCS